jgi:UDP-N-acetylmuramate--alanine ligase
VSGEGPLDLGSPRRIHVVNLGGAGMSAIATVLAQMGHRVSGTDDRETPFLPPLRDLGVAVHVGPAAGEDVRGVDAVVTSTATPADHPDVRAARGAAVPVLHRRDALAAICAERSVLAVAGTHGKSTTTGLVATVLDGVGDGAGYLAGTRIAGLGANADWRTGPGFVVEADESDGTFLDLGATDAIVTNLEADHLSHWGTEEALVDAFGRFVAALDGTAVLCLDDPGSAGLVAHARQPLTYGTDERAEVRVTDVGPAGIGVRFRLHHAGASVEVEVPAAPGLHNARNAAGALAACLVRGVPLADGARAIGAFAGVARRFEQRGTAGGITFVDSYDHLPTEVAAALSAARTGPFERVVCVFQPHRYTRTRDLAHTFADAFTDADVLAVTGLYPAGEAPIEGVSGRLVLDAVAAAHPGADTTYLPDLDAAVDWLLDVLRPGDLCLTLNAGDLTTVPDRVLAALGQR